MREPPRNDGNALNIPAEQSGLANASWLVFPPFRFDPANEQLWQADRRIPLEPKPMAVLRYLLERHQRLVKKEELLSRLWGDVTVGDAVLKTCLSQIRQALGDSSRAPRFIETAHRRGYRFIAHLESSPSSRSAPAMDGQVRAAPSTRKPWHFVGRERELRALEDRLAGVLSGERRVVTVSGDPGIGKTMLVDAFIEQARSRHAPWIGRGQCVRQYGQGEPYMPIMEALGGLGRGPGGEEVIQVLRRHAPSWLSEMPGLLSSLSERVELERRFTGGTPQLMLREAAEALEALSESRGCILVLEDVHWADYSTLDLLSYITRRSAPAALLVIATYRPLELLTDADHRGDILQELRRCARYEELPLPALNEPAISAYLAGRFPEHALPSPLSDMLRVRTAGNPLFLCRVVDGWIEHGLLSKEPEHGELRLTELSRAMPVSLRRMLEAELERLAPFELKVLQAASVAGMDFSTAAVAAALDEDVASIEEICLRWARRQQFLRLSGTSEWPDRCVHLRCHFVHDLYHQVLYEQTGASLRVQLHRRIGERLEQGYGEQMSNVAAELCMHFERAGDNARAVRYLQLAAEQALGLSAYREAVDHLRRALSLLEKLPGDKRSIELSLLIPFGAALSVVSGYAAHEVDQVYRRAKELCDAAGESWIALPVLAGTASFYLVRAEYRVAHELGGQLLRLAEAQDNPRLQIEANMLVGYVCLYRAMLRDACSHLERAIVIAERAGGNAQTTARTQDPAIAARCELSCALWTMGFPDRALQRAQEALALAECLGQPFTQVFALHFLAVLHQFRREPSACQERAAALIELASQHEFTFFLALGRMVRGGALIELGDLGAGVALIDQGWAEFQATGAEVGGTYFRALLGQARAKTGRADEALSLLDEALLAARRNEEHWWQPELLRLRGELLMQGQPSLGSASASRALDLPASAEACFLEALRLSRGNGARMLELRAAKSFALLDRDEPGNQEARRVLSTITRWFVEGDGTPDLLEARRLVAQWQS
jgi:DNA-binding winged helix-turn-helix (wHTH) protein/tetratricopeptide (TPR) repeat protein